MKSVKEWDKEQERQKKKHTSINQRLRNARGREITLSISEPRSAASKFFNAFIRKELGIPVKEEADE